ncbi:MAG: ORF6N domain-containing protein [Bacteroidota bacterium]
MKNKIVKTNYSSLIYEIRGYKVMLDSDLAILYGVETKRLKEQVRRNIDRFPGDFMFVLNSEELNNLRSQIATSSWGGSRYGHMAFTEQGVAMLSSVLSSKRAIAVNIRIIRVFVKMRMLMDSQKEILKKIETLEKKDMELDEKVAVIFNYLKQLDQVRQNEEDFKKRKRIGFK